MNEIQQCKEPWQRVNEIIPILNIQMRHFLGGNSKHCETDVVQMFKVYAVLLRQVKLLCAWVNGCAFGKKLTHVSRSLLVR